MAAEPAQPPDWVVAFRKILEQERQQGFNNRAVIGGGLDSFIQRRVRELAPALQQQSDEAVLLRTPYEGLSEKSRERWVNGWLKALDTIPPALLQPPAGRPTPPNGAPESAARPAAVKGRRRRPNPPEKPADTPSAAAPDAAQPPTPARPPTASSGRATPPSRAAASSETPAASEIPAAAASPAESAVRPSAAAPEPPPDAAAARRPTPGGLGLDEPVQRLNGVDVKTAQRLQKLDIASVRDLLYHFPRRHQDYSRRLDIADLRPEEPCSVEATIWEVQVLQRGPKGKGARRDVEAIAGDETGNVRLIWFGQWYVARQLQPGLRVILSGKPEIHRGQLEFHSPEWERSIPGEASPHTGRLSPVYALTEGITAHRMRGMTWQTLRDWLGGLEETLPPPVLQRQRLPPLASAVFQAHYPDALADWETARRRLAFDELLTMQLVMLQRRQERQQGINGIPLEPPAELTAAFLESLPFAPTAAQIRCIDELAADLRRGTPPMHRLLQGEVGSGKTVVALAGLLAAAACGYQGAMMAPTEVLAEQHFATLRRLLPPAPDDRTAALSLDGAAPPPAKPHLLRARLPGTERTLAVGLLTGSTPAAAKRELGRMAAGQTLDLLVGTHALIQESVSLPGLALAVVDEQHRFGVEQRTALGERGGATSSTDQPPTASPHTLIMSATPIPRTLNLTLYGDLDISVVDEIPAGRPGIATHRLEPERRRAAYDFIRKQILAGRQAFVVCPLIHESEAVESKAATEEYERLSGEVFPDLRVGLLHGRMRPKEKDALMRRFRDGDMDILVTTAVVEVGIDVPNATVMLIEGADRFGLAQLHQFRGRVGRGEHRSYCLLLSESDAETANQRLQALADTGDGFALAEKDLELRGPGDFFGTRQSGLPNLRMANFINPDMPEKDRDEAMESLRDMLEKTRREAMRLLQADPNLAQPEHAALAAQVARFLEKAASRA